MAEADDWERRLLTAGVADQALLGEYEPRDQTRARLSAESRAIFEAFAAELIAAQTFIWVYFRGVDAVTAAEPADGLTRFARRFVTSPRPHEGVLPFAMPAVALVACLENYTTSIARIAPLDRAEFRKSYRAHAKGCRERREAPLSERAFLANRMKPTANKAGAWWFGQLDRCLGVQTSPNVRTSIATLIDFRNSYVHANRDPRALLGAAQSGLVSAWVYALWIIGFDLALAASG